MGAVEWTAKKLGNFLSVALTDCITKIIRVKHILTLLFPAGHCVQ